MTGFTSFEIAILTAMSDGEELLGILLNTAVVTERENTGHGFYTSFSVDRRQSRAPILASPVNGPNALMKDMGDGMVMGFLLWFDNGYPDCLEGFQYCDSQGNTVDLYTRDLATLAFTQLVPPTQTSA